MIGLSTAMKGLFQALAVDPSNPSEKILVVETRAQGRRLLQYLARQGLALLNITVETPSSLAEAVCAPMLAVQNPPKRLSRNLAIHIIQGLLQRETEGYFNTPSAKTAAAASELYAVFSEMALAQESLVSSSDKLSATVKLQQAYQREKQQKNAIDSIDLLTCANERAEGSVQWQNTQFYILSSSHYAPLERALLEKLSRQTLNTITLPTDPFEGLDYTFCACRGEETMLRAVFRDIRRHKRPVEDCALLYATAGEGKAIYQLAPRWNIPVTMAGGIPLSESELYHTMARLRSFFKGDFAKEQLVPLLIARRCAPKSATALAGFLTRGQGFFGEAIYALDDSQRPDYIKPEIWAGWQKFFEILLPLGRATTPVAEQKTAMQGLAVYLNLQSETARAGYAPFYALLDDAALMTQGGTLLLDTMLDLAEKTQFQPGPAEGASLLCLPAIGGLFTGRRHLYVVGLSRYALEEGGSESPILLDGEKRDYAGLATVATKSLATKQAFNYVIACHEGTKRFYYSNFNSTSMVDDEPPAPFFTQALARCKGAVENIEYVPDYLMTDGDAVLFQTPSLPAATDDQYGDGTEMKERIQSFHFSPSSLEMAYHCPMQFYLQYILKLADRSVQSPDSARWLDPSALGLTIHAILEEYFNPERKNDATLEDITKRELDRIATLYPTHNATEALAKPGVLDFITTSVQQVVAEHEASGREVVATELDFGGDDFTLELDGTTFHLRGSIDRVDKRPNGKYAIVDYKSSNVASFRQNLHLHLQHYLYTLAYEALHEGAEVETAYYQMLREDATFIAIEQNDTLRKEMSAKIAGLIRYISDEKKSLTPCPAFTLQGGKLCVGDRETRLKEARMCKKNCPYRDFCQPIWDNMQEEVAQP